MAVNTASAVPTQLGKPLQAEFTVISVYLSVRDCLHNDTSQISLLGLIIHSQTDWQYCCGCHVLPASKQLQQLSPRSLPALGGWLSSMPGKVSHTHVFMNVIFPILKFSLF